MKKFVMPKTMPKDNGNPFFEKYYLEKSASVSKGDVLQDPITHVYNCTI